MNVSEVSSNFNLGDQKHYPVLMTSSLEWNIKLMLKAAHKIYVVSGVVWVSVWPWIIHKDIS
jgi:hypothetical protein